MSTRFNVGPTGVLDVGEISLTGISTFSNTTDSSSASTGAVVVVGGLGVAKNTYLGQNLTVSGNFTVGGTTTTVNTETVTIADNLIIVNSGPSGIRDGGALVQRYQTANDDGLGDVVGDTALETGTVAATGASTVTLGGSASAEDSYYVDMWIKITAGTGVDQVRQISAYVGSTKVATLASAWTTQPTGATYSIHALNYTGIYFSASINRHVNAYTHRTDISSVTVQKYAGMDLNDVTIKATTNQIILGTTNTTTINATAPAASRVYTIPDAGGSASFVLTTSTDGQTIAGTITLSETTNWNTLLSTNQWEIADTTPTLMSAGDSTTAERFPIPICFAQPAMLIGSALRAENFNTGSAHLREKHGEILCSGYNTTDTSLCTFVIAAADDDGTTREVRIGSRIIGSGSSFSNDIVPQNATKVTIYASGSNVLTVDSDGINIASGNITMNGTATKSLSVDRHTTANTVGSRLTISSGGATAGATDKKAGELILSTGTSTGESNSIVRVRCATTGVAGSSDNSIYDRMVFSSGKFLANTSATTIIYWTWPLGSDTLIGALVNFTVAVRAGADYQTYTGTLNVAATGSNRSLVESGVATAITSGTLTVSWSFVLSSVSDNQLLIRCTPNTSLTPDIGYPKIIFNMMNLCDTDPVL